MPGKTLEVAHVDKPTDSTVVCVVRCVAGVVRTGDVFEVVRSGDAPDRPVSLRVSRMWRYEREVDLIDPPHTAKVELAGADVGAVPGSTYLLVLPERHRRDG